MNYNPKKKKKKKNNNKTKCSVEIFSCVNFNAVTGQSNAVKYIHSQHPQSRILSGRRRQSSEAFYE